MYNLNSTILKKRNYYKRFPRDGECQFCKLSDGEKIASTDSFVVLRNKFSYEIFDMCEVVDHLMVIPKKHTDKLSVLTKTERVELIDILIDYEEKGYNVFFREPKSQLKTVDHHHTHLLKLGKRVSEIEYIREPYSMIYKT